MVVGTKLGKRYPFSPVILHLTNISPKILFYEDVRTFGLAVAQGVVRNQLVVVDLELCAQLLAKPGDKLRAPVRSDRIEPRRL